MNHGTRRIEEDIPEGQEAPEPYIFWFHNTKIQQAISKKRRKVIRTFTYYQVRSLKDQAQEIEKVHLQYLKEKKNIERQIDVFSKYREKSTIFILKDILKIEEATNSRLPVLTG